MNLRIILADDHPFVLLGLKAMIEARAGVAVVGQAVGSAALIELLRRMTCDVLITDLSMPVSDGGAEDELNLIRRIRGEWPRICIVVMSTTTNGALLRVLASDGAVSLLGKTESMHELWRAIDSGRNGIAYIGHSIAMLLSRPAETECERLLVIPLSGMQTMVVRMFVEGRSISEIAAAPGCHRRTVTRQNRKAMVKLGVTNDHGLFSCVMAG
ncbi:MAG TPA: response regulator [Paraburkholderia sp.]|uniref:response regulator n=1 Tax=Paraburkholderia sp. TaxID=1926495 RepID=UPI002ED3BB57